jgi:hypothetical protein
MPQVIQEMCGAEEEGGIPMKIASVHFHLSFRATSVTPRLGPGFSRTERRYAPAESGRSLGLANNVRSSR